MSDQEGWTLETYRERSEKVLAPLPVAEYVLALEAELVRLTEIAERLRKGSNHNHFTRDIKPLGQCGACDHQHAKQAIKRADAAEEELRIQKGKA